MILFIKSNIKQIKVPKSHNMNLMDISIVHVIRSWKFNFFLKVFSNDKKYFEIYPLGNEYL